MTDHGYALELLAEAEARVRAWSGREDPAERHEVPRLLSLARRHAPPIRRETVRAFDDAGRLFAALGEVRDPRRLGDAQRDTLEACQRLRDVLRAETTLPPSPRQELPLFELLPWPLGRPVTADPL